MAKLTNFSHFEMNFKIYDKNLYKNPKKEELTTIKNILK
jgi:hypothetical protein